MGRTAEVMGRLGLPVPAGRLSERAWDVIVVGAGHNGLTAATYLAGQGRRVLVLERRDRVGGAATLEQPWPGFLISPCAYVVGLLHPQVVEELELHRHGYRVTRCDPHLYVPFQDGTSFTEWDDHQQTLAEVERLAPEDVEGFQDFERFWDRVRTALRPPGDDLWLGDPPDRELIEDRLGHDPDLIHALFDEPMVDHLKRFFSSERLISAFAGQGVIGTFASPYDPGTASIYFHHSSGRLEGHPGSWGYVHGGLGMVSFAICDAARQAGALVATRVPVSGIRPGEGVELEDGTRLAAPVVVSNADPRRTLSLVGQGVPAEYRRRVEEIPVDSPVAKVNYGLRALPSFADPHATRAMVTITGGPDSIHRSYQAARRGEIPDEFWCELYFQTAYDPSVAPEGFHTMSAFCQYVPYRPASGPWDDLRGHLGDQITAAIERFAPGFSELVLHREVLTPPDIEARIGLTGGHIFQGDCRPQHMWGNRPGPRTPMEGLYLCGAGTYPGGSVIAANGRNAAMAVLADT